MISLLTNLLRALAAWLELRLLRGRWELQRDIEDYHADTENAIAKLRAAGGTENNLRADRLRDALLRMQSISATVTADLSTPRADTASKAAGDNS